MSRGVLSIDRQCQFVGLPVPRAEHRFHPTRRWRFDWAFLPPTKALAIEVEGGAFVQGRHTRGAGFEADLEKYAEALILGWVILRVTPKMIADGRALAWIEQLLQ